MNYLPHTTAVLFAAVLTLAPAFAQENSPPASAADTANPIKELAARPVAGDAVIATVNGLELFASDLVLLYQELPPQYQQTPLQELYDPLLSRLIDRKLLAEAGRMQGLLDDDATLRRAQYAIDNILQQAYIRARVDDVLTEERLRTAYDAMVANDSGNEEIEARHILSRTREESEAVIEALTAGSDFAELAQEKSVGPSAGSGGALGFFARGQMVPEFEEAAFSLEPGTFSAEPVKSEFGWHVIKVEQRRKVQPPSFSEALPQLRAQEVNSIVEAIVADLRADAAIEEFPPEGLVKNPGAEGEQ